MMRRVLVDHARGHNRDKRGSGVVDLPLASADRIAKTRDVDLVTLDEALKRFIIDYPEESEIVELRFFGGLSITETAKVLKVSDSTVERGWRFARAWLVREMNRGCR
jgi:RNA polymerase sigma factor (TIGR02999 family)